MHSRKLRMNLLLAGTFLVCSAGLLNGQALGCPYPTSQQVTCSQPGCSRTIVIRNCNGPASNPACCNPDATTYICCGDSVPSAGNSIGACPPTGSKDCRYGLVVDTATGRTSRACTGTVPKILSGS